MYTPEQHSKLVFLYTETDTPIREIGKKMGKSETAIQNYIYRNLDYRRQPNWREGETGENRSPIARRVKKCREKKRKEREKKEGN